MGKPDPGRAERHRTRKPGHNVAAMLSLRCGFGFVVTYLASYKRRARRILEGEHIGPRGNARWRESLGLLIQRIIFRSPGERAVFNFVFRTLLNSEKHRVYLGAYFGVGLAFVAMGVITVFARHGYGAIHALHIELLSIPLVLTFFTLVGMRVVFALPAQLGSNWIFRLTEQKERQPYLGGVQRAMFLLGVMPILLVVIPFCIGAWGWRTAGLHLIFVLILAFLLREALIFRLNKIPFTCTYLPGKANLKLMFFPYLLAFTTYAYTMTTLERWLMQKPIIFSAFAFAALFLLAASIAGRKRKLSRLGSFIYDVSPLQAAEPLKLSH